MSVSLDVPLPALKTSDSINIPLPIKKAVASLQTNPEQNVSATMTNSKNITSIYQDKCRSWLQKLLMDIDEMPRDSKNKKNSKLKTAVVKPISGIKVLIPDNQYNPQLVKVIPIEDDDMKNNKLFDNQIYQFNLVKSEAETKNYPMNDMYTTQMPPKSAESNTVLTEVASNLNRKEMERNEEQALHDFLTEVDSIVVLPSQTKKIPHKAYPYDIRTKERLSMKKLDKNLDNEITKISKSLTQISQKLKDFSDFKIKLLTGTAYVGKVEGKLTKSEEDLYDIAKKYNKTSQQHKQEYNFDPLQAWKALSTESNEIIKEGMNDKQKEKVRYTIEGVKQNIYKKMKPNVTFADEFFKDSMIDDQNPPLLVIPGIKKEEIEVLSEERVNLSIPENETAMGATNSSMWTHYFRKEKEPTLENVMTTNSNRWNSPLFYSASQNIPVYIPLNMSTIEKREDVGTDNKNDMKENNTQWNISNKIEYITEEGNFNLSKNSSESNNKTFVDGPDVEIFEPIRTSTSIIEIIVSTTHKTNPTTTTTTTTQPPSTTESSPAPTEPVSIEKTTETIDMATKSFLVEESDAVLTENKTNNISVIPINNTLSLLEDKNETTNMSNEIPPPYHNPDDKKLSRRKTNNFITKDEDPTLQLSNMIETIGKSDKSINLLTPIPAESTISESKIKIVRDERGSTKSNYDNVKSSSSKISQKSDSQFGTRTDDYGGKVWKAYGKDSHNTAKRSIVPLPTPMGMNMNPTQLEYESGTEPSGTMNGDYNESSTMIKARRETPKPKDTKLKQEEFDTFAKNIIAHLKNMPFEEALKLQLKIQALITEERLRYIEDCKRQGASCSEVAANFYDPIFNMDNYGTFASTTNIEQLNDGVDI